MATKKKQNEIFPNAGYSGTPLIKKLGIKEGFKVRLIGETSYYVNMLKEIPRLKIEEQFFKELDFIHLFVTDEMRLAQQLPELKKQIKQTGIIWISWPKKSSGIKSSVTDMIVRRTGIANGLVDIKVCAVDEIWSGLKFVIPVKDRS